MASIYINKSDTESDTLPIPAVLSTEAGLAINVLKSAFTLAVSGALAVSSVLML